MTMHRCSLFLSCVRCVLLPMGVLLTPQPVFSATGGFASGTGSSQVAVDVHSLSDLQTAFKNRKTHMVVHGKIYGGSVPYTFTFADTGWNNTTIEGARGGGAVLENIQLKFSGERLADGVNIEHIVVRNITFCGNIADLQALPPGETDVTVPGKHSGVNYLGVSFRRCNDVWLDHCTIYDTSDNLWCATLASDNLTVSCCHFYFTSDWLAMNPNPLWNWVGKRQPLADERLCAVIGKSWDDSHIYGSQKLRITLHHNWFGPLMKGRPLNRGYAHYYNNYFDNTAPGSGQYNALQINGGSRVDSENNYFEKTHQSNQVRLEDGTHTAYTFCERNNIYDKTTGQSATGTAWPDSPPVPYGYTLHATGDVPDLVRRSAGPK